jgi:hypothetical protein
MGVSRPPAEPLWPSATRLTVTAYAKALPPSGMYVMQPLSAELSCGGQSPCFQVQTLPNLPRAFFERATIGAGVVKAVFKRCRLA